MYGRNPCIHQMDAVTYDQYTDRHVNEIIGRKKRCIVFLCYCPYTKCMCCPSGIEREIVHVYQMYYSSTQNSNQDNDISS